MDELNNLKMNDKNNNFFTRNWWNNIVNRLYSIIKTVKPYKVYIATITKQENEEPIVNVLENTLGKEIIWSANEPVGITGTITSSTINFSNDKTIFYTDHKLNGFAECDIVNSNTINIAFKTLYIDTGQLNARYDGICEILRLEIRVYS